MHVHFQKRGSVNFVLVISSMPQYRRVMSESDVHYTLSLVNHHTGHQLKLELIDLPFPARSYRVRVHPVR
jgi:hypothetical protein